jgi:S1-C subfamily serine protease
MVNMTVGARRSRTRMLSRLVISLALVVALVLGAPVGLVLAQIDPAVRDRVLPAAVQVGLLFDVTEDGVSSREFLPVGSGTIVSPDGLILTNWHVVDMATNQAELDAWEAHASEDGVALTLDLDATQLVILTTGGSDLPEPAYLAQVVAEHHALDFAVLQITGDADGHPIEPTSLDIPYVPLGDSSTIRQGDPIHLFGYPTVGGGSLQYTAGVVSGFNVEEGIDGRAWITTDATMAGGSSGGTVIDGEGRLIGVPTQGTALDCRPGDTNFDGRGDAGDVGCIPVGGSIGQLRPINLARDLLAQAGLDPETVASETDPVAEPASAPAIETPTVTTAEAPPLIPEATVTSVESEQAPSSSQPAPDGTAQYESILDYCRASPVHPVGTRIVLADGARPRDDFGNVIETLQAIPAGTTVEIIGPFLESGDSDLWPIRYRTPEGAEQVSYVNSWVLHPEWTVVTDEEGRIESKGELQHGTPMWLFADNLPPDHVAYCAANPNYSPGTTIVLPSNATVWRGTPDWFRSYDSPFASFVPAATIVEITGPSIETGDCDWWPIRFERPPLWGHKGRWDQAGTPRLRRR